MIKLQSKDQCCGCSACIHICPKQSIRFMEDSEGFLYPKVDLTTCVDCGLCEKVCPIINQSEVRKPLIVYAAKHPNEEVRLASSSGGIFTLLAEKIIDEGGVVFGARFNEKWEVIHHYTETKDGLAPFRGSKYVQSVIGDSYVSVESFLKDGRKVMFTGTPCQVAGLKKYLRKEYDNLLTVDFICHGVPSPMVWRKYLMEELAHRDNAIFTGINFRDKSTGWKEFSFVLNFSKASGDREQCTIKSSVFTDNAYMQVFLSNLSLRPSCYNCPVKSGKSGSDITIGDFWGIEMMNSQFDDDRGVSLIFINKVLSPSIFDKCSTVSKAYEDAIKQNPAVVNSPNFHPFRDMFMSLCDVLGFKKAYSLTHSSNFFCRVFRKIYRLI